MFTVAEKALETVSNTPKSFDSFREETQIALKLKST